MEGDSFVVYLLTIGDGIVYVKAAAGDTRHGGEEFDNHIIKFCWWEFLSVCQTMKPPTPHADFSWIIKVRGPTMLLPGNFRTKLTDTSSRTQASEQLENLSPGKVPVEVSGISIELIFMSFAHESC